MAKHYIIVEHRNAAAYDQLRREVDRLRTEVADLHQKFRRLEVRFAQEVHLNMELVDLLNANKIKYRSLLDYRERERSR